MLRKEDGSKLDALLKIIFLEEKEKQLKAWRYNIITNHRLQGLAVRTIDSSNAWKAWELLWNKDLKHTLPIKKKWWQSKNVKEREDRNSRVDINLSLGGAISLNFAPEFSLKFNMKTYVIII